MISLMKTLWALNRSITGRGLRETLAVIKSYLPELEIHGVESGTKVLDWTIPEEWNISEAYLKDPEGKIIADFSKNNLHVIGYSTGIDKELSLEELQPHLYSLPDQPDAVPYITSYYNRNWGFCISEEQKQKLKPGIYKAYIDARHFKGSLNYADIVIKGESEKEVFFSTYCCHPSMANNELSGPCVAVALAQWLLTKPELKYTYRFVFAPETIGSATYLEKNIDHLTNHVIAAFNLTCVGDERSWSFLPSRLRNTYTDKVALHTLKFNAETFKEYSWTERGSDEKMYCAPFIDLPMVSVMRSKHGTYPEYHTSLDTIGRVVTEKGLKESVEMHKKMIETIENDCYPKTQILGEPQLGKRNLYPKIGRRVREKEVALMLDFISYCDGSFSLLDIAEKNEVSFQEILKVYHKLNNHKIII